MYVIEVSSASCYPKPWGDTVFAIYLSFHYIYGTYNQ